MTRPPEDSGEAEHDPDGLRVTIGHQGPVRIVALVGELDHDSADGLRAALAPPAEGGIERIVVDLAGLRFCDSTGLNILLRARLEGEAAGLGLELAGVRPMVARLFAVTGADSVLHIHPDVEAALKAPGPARGPGRPPAAG